MNEVINLFKNEDWIFLLYLFRYLNLQKLDFIHVHVNVCFIWHSVEFL